MRIDRKKIAAALLILSIAVFSLFFVRVYLSETNAIEDHQESCVDHEILADFQYSQWSDSKAPVGVRQQYRWMRRAGEYDGASIAFFLVHQSVQVYYNDEMVYALEPDADNVLTATPGSNWVMLPLHDAQHDCDIRVVVTPHYPDIIERKVEIMVGSQHSIFLETLQENLIYVLLAILSILMGSIALGSCLYSAFMRRKVDITTVYLGITLILVGVWRITDTRLSAFLFPGNVLALDYITIGTLFLLCILFGLATRTRIRRHMYIVSILCGVVSMGVIIGHLFRWWDMRDMLRLAHGMVVLNAVIMILAETVAFVRKPAPAGIGALLMALLPLAGALADVLCFYALGSSADMFFVVVGALAYAGSTYATTLRDARRRMFADEQTGLYNRARWENLMDGLKPGSCGIILCDLNHLKQINDSFGHVAGDSIICNFADILRQAAGPGQIICRWGGDEFAILAPGASLPMLQNILAHIHAEVERYNLSAGDLQIQYAAGCVAGSEAPGLSMRELFRMADKRMYANKRDGRH